MSSKEAFQTSSKETRSDECYSFPAKTVIYIDGWQSAVLRVQATGKRTGKKIKGLAEYTATCRLDLFYNGNFWSLREGTIFTAYQNKARRIQESSN